jgi:quinol monooxygenase YgiN
MTVIVTARLGIRRPSDARQGLALQRRNVVAFMKERGCLHHHVLELNGEWWLFEEWKSSELFETFFDCTPQFRQALREAGFREFPDDVRLWQPIQNEDELRAVVGAAGA